MIEFTEKEIKEIEDFYYSDNFNRKINELGKQFEERYEKFRDSPEKIIEKIKTAFIFFYLDKKYGGRNFKKNLTKLSDDEKNSLLASLRKEFLPSYLVSSANIEIYNLITNAIQNCIENYAEILAPILRQIVRKTMVEYSLSRILDIIHSLTDIGKNADILKMQVEYVNILLNGIIDILYDPATFSKEKVKIIRNDENNSLTFSENTNKYSITISKYKDIFKNVESFSIKTSVFLLLDMLIIGYNQDEDKSHIIALPLSYYRGKRMHGNIEKSKEKVRVDVDLLSNISISYYDKSVDFYYKNVKIIDQFLLKDNILFVHFSEKFIDILDNNSSQMPYPLSALTVSCGNESSDIYFMLRKIIEHKHLNSGKKNENIISVKDLLKVCSNLPKEEAVAFSSNKSFSRITEPFIRNLKKICAALDIEGNCCFQIGDAIMDIDDKSMQDYGRFINAYITVNNWKIP